MNEDILNQLGEPSEEPTEEVKVPNKTKSSGKPLDDEVIASMLANGDNTAGMFTPDESELLDETNKDKLHEEVDKDAKVKTKGDAKPSKKYETEFKKAVLDNPEEFFVDTPRGRMSIKEAQKAGYNPVTHRFEKGNTSRLKEDLEQELNEQDKQAIDRLTDPSQLGLAPADAEELGVAPDSKMVRQPNPMQGAQMPSPSPAQVATPMSAPTAGPTPTPGQAPAGGQDILSMLGGNV